MRSAREITTMPGLDRVMREVYAWWMALGSVVIGFTPDGSSRIEFAREGVRRALSSPPDMAVRHSLVGAISVAGAILAAVVGFGGMGLWIVLSGGNDALLRLIQQSAFALSAASIVLLVRSSFERRDYNRWRAAGRPEHWQPGYGATLKGWDLIVILVVGCLMWLLAGASFDATL